MNRAIWPTALLLVAFLTGATAALLASAGGGAFTTPDESGNFLAATSLAERGSYLLEAYGSDVDPEGALGPRTHVRTSDGFAPFQTPLTPLVQALGISLTGTLWISSALMAGLGSIGLLLSMRQLVPGSRVVPLTVFATLIPVLYWMVHQYGTAGTYVTVEGWAIYFAMRSWRRSSLPNGFVASLLHALALVARPDFTVITSMAVLAVVVGFGRDQKCVRSGSTALGLTVLAVLFAAAAMLTYNAILFDDPLRVGSAALADRFGLSSQVDVEGANPFSFIVALAFPQGEPDIRLWPRSVYKYLIYSAPIFTALSVHGGIALFRRNSRSRTLLIMLTVTIIIGMVVRLDDNLQDSESWSPSPRGSISRYWLPSYLIMTGLAVIGAETARRQLGQMTLVVAPLTMLLVVFGIYAQYSGVSVRYEIARLYRASDLAQEVSASIGDESAIVYSLVDDKFFGPSMATATLAPLGKEELYEAEWALASIRRQLESGQVVYIYSRERNILLPLMLSDIVVLHPTETPGLYEAQLVRES